jgi:PiT family inorganic phosphate transporter
VLPYFLIATIVIALIFDLINGFHDAANSIATVVSTRVLRPVVAVFWAAFFNMAAMFVFTPHVAETVSQIVRVEPHAPVYVHVLFSGLIAAIVWDLITWWVGLPTSSSHALIGGICGAGVAHAGFGALRMDKLIPTLEYIVLAPLLGFFLGMVLMFAAFWAVRNWHPAQVDSRFRVAQLCSAALYSLGHGANDAQKTMGIILALLIAQGTLPETTLLSIREPDTLWIIIACQGAIALGTAMGGWRIVKTMGMKITKLNPIGGFCAETSGALTLFFATLSGIPVSTTQTITGSIIGVGSVKNRLSHIRWGVAARIVWAWILTIPATALIGAALAYLVISFFSLG